MATPITAGAVAGEYMETFVIVEWRVGVGDTVAEGDVLLTIETAKAAVDIEAPSAGVVSAIFAEADSEVPAAAVLCLIGKDSSDVGYDGDDAPVKGSSLSSAPAPAMMVAERAAEAPRAAALSARIIASPAARRAASAAGVDLRAVRASSPSGRIKLRDVSGASQSVPAFAAPVSAGLPADENGPLEVHRSGAKGGTPVFMIHGFASDSLSWYPLDRQLAKDHPVYRLDLPNHGTSPKRQIGSFANLVREVRDAFDTLGLDGAHVIGHSLGGALALALADTRPRKLASLTLFAPGGLGPKVNGDFISGIARASRPDSLAAWLKVMVHDQKLIDPAFANAAFAARADGNLRAAQSHMGETLFADGTQSFDLVAALHRLECPTRIIWGRKDRVLDWHDALQAPGHVGLHFLPDVGHVPQLEAPDLSLGIISALIKSV
ncbi:alpha/beta fold hydrolase (plasmid) [Shinella sp. H4-D48]|uniref:alpha/beta fold hydrolase n=1 Tax=Shinella sp. H4-D48 TaxID=2925841 RepID=UPI001F53C39B|nr:alpha/beta fold hydrolase [Shinella sp. H4-D48]UNK40679.1 alpha/beta fold hydrolase [Shinella sp. H4-D48]